MGPEIQELIRLISKLPGLGPRSGRRVALHLLKNKQNLLKPLVQSMTHTLTVVKECAICRNIDTQDPCALCQDPRRDPSVLCVVEDVTDLWALERSASFKGSYHILGGTLSALDGKGPQDLRIGSLVQRVAHSEVSEVILALSATIDGQTTAHYVMDRLSPTGVEVSAIAHGVPLGGELDYLDDGTITTALNSRRALNAQLA
ncbi:MAG: recombination mediator RecR [Pseudomonadota bacterium]